MKRSIVLLLMLASCGGSPPQPSQPEDETLQRETSAGELAYTLERPEEAVADYKAALTRAQERDDIGAIGDIGFNLAVAELRADDPHHALSVARATRAELERRKQTVFPALLLAEATALFRLGRLDEASAIAARAQAGSDAQTSARAIFLQGLIADQRGDGDGLAAAVAALHPGDEASLKADASELSARLALRRGAAGEAVSQAEQAAALRQNAIDYRGLARALALAGQAAKQGGDSAAAADLFLRSGRSAAAQHDTASARLWLQQAVMLGGQLPVGEAAQALLRELDQGGDRGGTGS